MLNDSKISIFLQKLNVFKNNVKLTITCKTGRDVIYFFNRIGSLIGKLVIMLQFAISLLYLFESLFTNFYLNYNCKEKIIK